MGLLLILAKVFVIAVGTAGIVIGLFVFSTVIARIVEAIWDKWLWRI